MWERQCKAVIRFDYPAADRMGSAVGECLFLREVRGTIVVPERENIDPPSAVFPVPVDFYRSLKEYWKQS